MKYKPAKQVIIIVFFISIIVGVKAQGNVNLGLKYEGLLSYFSRNYSKDIDSIKSYWGKQDATYGYLHTSGSKLYLDESKKYFKVLSIGDSAEIRFQEVKKNNLEGSIVGYNIISVMARVTYGGNGEYGHHYFLKSNFVDYNGNILSNGRRFEKLLSNDLALFSVPTGIDKDQDLWYNETLKNFEICKIDKETFKPIDVILKINNCDPDKVYILTSSKDKCIKDINVISIFDSKNRVSRIFYKFITFENKVGLMNSLGQNIAEPIYESIDPLYTESDPTKNFFITIRNSRIGITSLSGKVIFEPTLQDFSLNDFKQNGIATFKYNDRYGAIDENMKILIEPQYQRLYLLSKNKALYQNWYAGENYNRWDFLDINKQTRTNYNIQEVLSDDIHRLEHIDHNYINERVSRIGVRINYKWGYCDNKGNLVIQPKFSSILSLNDGLALVTLSTQVFVEDKRLYHPKGVDFHHGNYVTKTTKSFIRKDGSTFLTLSDKLADEISEVSSNFYDGLLLFKSRLTGKLGYIGLTGKVEIEPYFDQASHFYNGKADVVKFGTSFQIDKKGNRL